MAKYYSPTTRGFYDDSFHENMPEDVVQVSDADYAELFALQSEGKAIVPDENGYPVSADQPPLPLPIQADAALVKTDDVATRCFKAGVAYPDDWKAYTQALRNIKNGTDTTSTELPNRPPYPSGT